MKLSEIFNNIRKSDFIKKSVSYYSKNSLKIKILILVLVCSGMIIRGIMQQPQIIANKAEIAALNESIEYEKNRQEEVEQMREIADTEEYIEKIARDKLGMIKADERIFIDVSKSQNN